MARLINLIVIHCSDTPNERTLYAGSPGTPGWQTPDREIDGWHAQRGFRRDAAWRARHNARLEAIGYHFVIDRRGVVFTGRHLDEAGAHLRGWNKASVGVCLVGRDKFTADQWQALANMVRGLEKEIGVPAAFPLFTKHPARLGVARAGVCGHRDVPGVAKSCPGFPVAEWLAGGCAPLSDHMETTA